MFYAYKLKILSAAIALNSVLAQPSPPVTGAPKAAQAAPANAPQAAESTQTPAQTPAQSQTSVASAPQGEGSGHVENEPGADEVSLEKSMLLRDPFRRPAPKLATGQEEGGTVPELERFELDKFSLIGVITGLKKNKALITTPEGKMHIVSETTVMGTRKGFIKKIAPGFITIEEKVVNLLGQEERIETLVKLKDKDKEKKDTL